MNNKTRYILAGSVFLFTAFCLSMVQLKVESKMLLLERFFDKGGWIEIMIVSAYGALVAWKMYDIKQSAKWRLLSWSIFSAWFFLQLFLGITLDSIFLLTGKLHLPIPAMMIGGPLYRGQLSVMTILFLSTIVLSGPAWCSHLCYFGALDGQFAKRGKAGREILHKNRTALKGTVLLLIIAFALAFRWLGVSALVSTISGLVFGIIGLLVILKFSKKKGKMTHCIMYCPIGTLVNYLRFVNPFRFKINTSCTQCMACIKTCRYDALNINNIKKKKPGITCTLCGDCISSCHDNAIGYVLFKTNQETARLIYLFISISLHAMFLALGRI